MAAPKVERFSSALIPLPAENVDTDQIVPARYLKVVVKSGLADALFHDWRFNEDAPRRRRHSSLMIRATPGEASSLLAITSAPAQAVSMRRGHSTPLGLRR